MTSETVLMDRGMRALSENLGIVDSEKFITLVRRDAFDYTQWRKDLFKDITLEEFLLDAKAYSESLPENAVAQ